MNKLIGLILVIVAVLLPFAAKDAFESIPRAVWYTSGAMLVVGLILLKLKYRSPRAARSRNVFASSLAELADGIEDKSLSIDPTTKAILKDLYATLDEISTQLTDGETQAADESIQDVMYDIERAVYPNGMSEKQSAALSRRKPKRRATHILIFALCATSTFTATAEWEIEKHADEMTDQVSYFFASEGDKYDVSSCLRETPYIILKITPVEIMDTGGLKYKYDSFFQVKSDGMNRAGITATVRFDKNSPEEWFCPTSTDRRSAFFPNVRDPIKRMMSATNLLIRFETTLGAIRTLHFDVSGLKQKLLELKADLISKHPLGTKFIDTQESKPPPAPRKPKCSKCGGTGEIVTWKRCTRCYGSGTSGGAPCPKCRTSTRKGYIRHAAPCATCHGQ